MSTHGQFNSKSPTIKRILKEAKELSASPSSVYHAAPLETNLFEWHFTIRGPPSPSDFAGGLYHGRIVLPNTYPLRPPSFRFLTPSGRFEVNREICLSISGHHEETWQPAWGIRTALVAIRSFMDSDAMGQLGGLTTGKTVRHRLAEDSKSWKCSTCGGKTNEEIMKERQADCAAANLDSSQEDDIVPDELRLGYRDELEKLKEEEEEAAGKEAKPSSSQSTPPQSTSSSNENTAEAAKVSNSPSPNPMPAVSTQRTVTTHTRSTTIRPPARARQVSALSWIDMAISVIAMLLLAMVLKKIM